jgi:hypothetical protein
MRRRRVDSRKAEAQSVGTSWLTRSPQDISEAELRSQRRGHAFHGDLALQFSFFAGTEETIHGVTRLGKIPVRRTPIRSNPKTPRRCGALSHVPLANLHAVESAQGNC